MTSPSDVFNARPVLGAAAMLANTVFVPIIGVAVKALSTLGVGAFEMLARRAIDTSVTSSALTFPRGDHAGQFVKGELVQIAQGGRSGSRAATASARSSRPRHLSSIR